MLEKLKEMTFANEAEEAAWWESHEDELLEEFEKAETEGRLGHGTALRLASLPSTMLRLDPDDEAMARKQAEKRGVSYEAYLQTILQVAIRNAELVTKT
jgi:hypothetical protein